MGVSPMEQQEYSFTIAFSSYLLRGLGDGRPQPEHQSRVSKSFLVTGVKDLATTSPCQLCIHQLSIVEYYRWVRGGYPLVFDSPERLFSSEHQRRSANVPSFEAV
jgi:hypothetical protein